MSTKKGCRIEFWKDTYILSLKKDEKFLYLYLFVNPRIGMSGIYQMSLSTLLFETGFDDTALEILDKFETDRKIKRKGDWFFIRNFVKHNVESVQDIRQVEVELNQLGDELKEWKKEVVKVIEKKQSIVEESVKMRNTGKNLALTGQKTLMLDGGIDSGIVIDELKFSTIEFPENPTLAKQIVVLIEMFEKTVNPTISYANKTIRKGAENLITKFGYDQSVRLAKVAICVQGMEFSPTIITPYHLFQKFGNLNVFVQRHAQTANKATPKKGIVISKR
jgi:hypothetical protein